MRRLVAALAVLLVLTGCDGSVTPPDNSAIDVDTPELRAMKAEAGIEDCVPGPGGGRLPSLTLACLGGGPDVDLSSLKGPLLINLWYSGCGPCRDEMPALQDFYDQHGDDVAVLGIDVENYPQAAISFAEIVGATYPQLADPGGYVFDQAELGLKQAFPQTLVVDADGVVVATKAGEFGSAREIDDFVTDALGPVTS